MTRLSRVWLCSRHIDPKGSGTTTVARPSNCSFAKNRSITVAISVGIGAGGPGREIGQKIGQESI
jgi:hypothetical protein